MSATYCCVTNYPKALWLKTTICHFSQFCGLHGQFPNWSYSDSLLWLWSPGGSAGLAGPGGPHLRVWKEVAVGHFSSPPSSVRRYKFSPYTAVGQVDFPVLSHRAASQESEGGSSRTL